MLLSVWSRGGPDHSVHSFGGLICYRYGRGTPSNDSLLKSASGLMSDAAAQAVPAVPELCRQQCGAGHDEPR